MTTQSLLLKTSPRKTRVLPGHNKKSQNILRLFWLLIFFPSAFMRKSLANRALFVVPEVIVKLKSFMLLSISSNCLKIGQLYWMVPIFASKSMLFDTTFCCYEKLAIACRVFLKFSSQFEIF